MAQQWIVIYLLIAYAYVSHQMSTQDSETYTAAVVEYPSIYVTNDSEATLRANSDAYVKHIKTASEGGADIIVFPEDGLTSIYLPDREYMEDWATIIPAYSDNYTPCTQTTIDVSEAMKKISCAARENQIYVVINIAEKLPCNNNDKSCPKEKMFFYNSNAVFDRTGKVIARYRKTNLFMEPQFNVTDEPDITIFDTDFGVKFGTFICFDVLFHAPTLQLTRFHRITDIVYPTAWFSELPFLTAVQAQSGWSFAEDVNFLASGYNRPTHGNTGSGIYLGRKGIGKAILPHTVHEEVLIHEVPKIKERTRPNHGGPWDRERDGSRKRREGDMGTWRDDVASENGTVLLLYDNMRAYETHLLEGNVTKKICQNDFCCEFDVGIARTDLSTKYRLIAFSGFRNIYVDVIGVRGCSIIQCSNDSIASCGSVQESGTVFSNVLISATFHDYKNILVMPSTLDAKLFPLKDWTYDEHFHENHMHVSMSLNNPTNNILTFGIFSRNFDRNGASATVYFNIITYFIMSMITLAY